MPHPTIAGFGAFQFRGHRLVLDIGREPNCLFGTRIINTVQAFEINHAPRCCYWNRAHAQLARIGGNIKSSEFRMIRTVLNSSPIIFADALPVAIPYGHPDRDQIRQQTAGNIRLLEEHVENIFSNEAVIARVQLVILSGLTQNVFNNAVTRIQQQCALNNIPSVAMPFYGSRCSHDDLDAAIEGHAHILEHVFEQFINHAPN